MKISKFKFGLLAIASLCMAMTFVGCDDDTKDEGGTSSEDPNGYELKGELSSTRVLLEGKTYNLTGGYTVRNGGVLKIEKGVTVIAKGDSDCDYILIEQGGKIDAQGTKEAPIVMTSDLKEPGAWGGVHICGKAPINLVGGTGKSEIGDAVFGGNNPEDNSGVLRYIRLEYTGFAFTEEKESNGFTFYGVGNGTVVEYLQAYKGADDGFEWFGGTVNAKYLISTDSGDDSFDWTDGWVGKGQFWVAYQTNSDGDCLIEADNREDNYLNTPISNPTLANLTLVGNGSVDAKRGVRLRRGTYVQLYNTIITGKPQALTTESDETENSFLNGNSVVEYTYISTVFNTSADLGLESKTGNAAGQTINLSGYKGVVDGGKDMSTIDSYFVKAEYRGAVNSSNDWTSGWSK